MKSKFKRGQKVKAIAGSQKGKVGYILGSDLNPHIDTSIGWVMQATLVDEKGEFLCFAWEMNLVAENNQNLSKGQQLLLDELHENDYLDSNHFDSRSGKSLASKGLVHYKWHPLKENINNYRISLVEDHFHSMPYDLHVAIENAENDNIEITKDFIKKEASYIEECYREEGHVLYKEDVHERNYLIMVLRAYVSY